MSRGPGRPSRTAAEWWAFGVAVALVAAVAAVILASWAVGDRGPADVRAGAAGPAERVGDVWRVPFEVRNRGGRAATSVQVTGELEIAGTVVGEGEQSFDFLSGGERESGAFLFPEDPEKGELSIAVASYADP